MHISATIIVKNEEAVLDRCLGSLSGLDSITVVDTGSSDSTVEIARKYTDKVFFREWDDDYSAARNYAIEKSEGDWCLELSADEYLPEGQIEKMRELIANNDVDGFFFDVYQKETFSHIQVRLFKREFRFVGRTHEVLNSKNHIKTDLKVVHEHGPNHHKDRDMDLRILKEEVKSGEPRKMFYLAREFYYHKDYISAIEWYKKYIEKSTWLPEKADAYLTMSKCYWYTQQGDLARQSCMQAIIINPNFKKALEFMADIVWPKHKSRWLDFSKGATNDETLFV